MMIPKLTIIAQGLHRFAVCNERFESNLLKDAEAQREIRVKYGRHGCKRGAGDPVAHSQGQSHRGLDQLVSWAHSQHTASSD